MSRPQQRNKVPSYIRLHRHRVHFLHCGLHRIGSLTETYMAVLPYCVARQATPIVRLAEASGIDHKTVAEFLQERRVRMADQKDVGRKPLTLFPPPWRVPGRVSKQGIGGHCVAEPEPRLVNLQLELQR